ncbi:MAG: DUF4105 domain-containing protein [Candidatus Levyibacteriota bacterium]
MVHKKILLGLLGILLFTTLVFLLLNRPSNNRDWDYGFETVAGIQVSGNEVAIKNLRNMNIVNNQAVFTYAPRKVSVTDVAKAWFVFEPFSIPNLQNFKGVAHTYLVFDFVNGSPIAISVEARREKGEDYSAYWGMVNKFELINIWSTEEDATIQRGVLRKSELYMFPLEVSRLEAQGLFLQLAKDTQELEAHPRFYNSLLANCTSELAVSANKSKPGIIPLTIATFFPGYADKEMYRLKLIPHDKTLAQVKAEYYISDLVNKFYPSEDFSLLLRDSLPRKSLALQ